MTSGSFGQLNALIGSGWKLSGLSSRGSAFGAPLEIRMMRFLLSLNHEDVGFPHFDKHILGTFRHRERDHLQRHYISLTARWCNRSGVQLQGLEPVIEECDIHLVIIVVKKVADKA